MEVAIQRAGLNNSRTELPTPVASSEQRVAVDRRTNQQRTPRRECPRSVPMGYRPGDAPSMWSPCVAHCSPRYEAVVLALSEVHADDVSDHPAQSGVTFGRSSSESGQSVRR